MEDYREKEGDAGGPSCPWTSHLDPGDKKVLSLRREKGRLNFPPLPTSESPIRNSLCRGWCLKSPTFVHVRTQSPHHHHNTRQLRCSS